MTVAKASAAITAYQRKKSEKELMLKAGFSSTWSVSKSFHDQDCLNSICMFSSPEKTPQATFVQWVSFLLNSISILV